MSKKTCDDIFSLKCTRPLLAAVNARVKMSIFGSRAEYVRALIRRDLASNASSADLTQYHIPDWHKADKFDALLEQKFCRAHPEIMENTVN